MPTLAIDDMADPRLSDYRNVPDPELARARGVFIAEGRLVVSRLLGTPLGVRSVMVTAPAFGALRRELDARPEVPVYLVPQATMNAVTGFNMHRGCLAVGERPAPLEWRQLAASGGRCAVALDCLGDADNVGSVFRNAAALGASFVLLGPACADPLYRKAIRTSMGAALWLPYAHVEPWPAALTEFRGRGWAVVGTTPAGDARPLRDVALAVAQRPVLIVLGHEGTGLADDVRAACEHMARIPITGRVDSLNVAAASAIALYEMHQGLDQ